MTDEELEQAATVYQRVAPFLWCSVDKRTGECSWRQRWQTGATAPFTWSPERPAPTDPLAVRFDEAGRPRVEPRDFPNPDYVWGHPTFKAFIAAYEHWGIPVLVSIEGVKP